MQFKIATIIAAVLCIGTALGGCYKGGASWCDVGTTDDINQALGATCADLADKYYVGNKVSNRTPDHQPSPTPPQRNLKRRAGKERGTRQNGECVHRLSCSGTVKPKPNL